ncbi:MAG: M23 family metallopeptidase [Acidimicrobiales bacterium]
MSRRARSALALVPTLAGLITGGAWQARAQTPPATQAPPVQPQQAPPTTTNLLQELLNKLLPTTTTVPPAAPTVPPPPVAPDSAPVDPGGAGAGGAAPESASQVVPPEAQAIINSVLRTGSSNNLALLAALKPLADQGLTQEEAALVGMGQFPVAGEAYWSDDWWMARFTPAFHLHQGTDIFAARGTPVRAPADGRVEFQSEGAGGQAAYVTVPDGTYYYMAHLDRFAPDVRSGQTVKQGRVVGFTGSTGNAEGGSPHVHFEIHPGGGGAANPKLTLDRWVAEAIKAAPRLLGTFDTSVPRPLSTAGMLRRLDTGSFGGPTTNDGPQLWTRSVRRENGAVRLTAIAAGGSDESATWDPMTRGADAFALDVVRAQQLANDLLTPLTPKVLAAATTRAGGG